MRTGRCVPLSRFKQNQSNSAPPAAEPSFLSPEQIRQQRFSVSLKGYQMNEVESFLDAVAQQVEIYQTLIESQGLDLNRPPSPPKAGGLPPAAPASGGQNPYEQVPPEFAHMFQKTEPAGVSSEERQRFEKEKEDFKQVVEEFLAEQSRMEAERESLRLQREDFERRSQELEAQLAEREQALAERERALEAQQAQLAAPGGSAPYSMPSPLPSEPAPAPEPEAAPAAGEIIRQQREVERLRSLYEKKLLEADEQAEQMVATAHQKADEIVADARTSADGIVERAQAEAERIRADADSQAERVKKDLEVHKEQVRQRVEQLHKERQNAERVLNEMVANLRKAVEAAHQH